MPVIQPVRTLSVPFRNTLEDTPIFEIPAKCETYRILSYLCIGRQPDGSPWPFFLCLIFNENSKMEGRIGTLIVCGFVVLLFYIVALGLIFADLWAGVRKAKQRGEFRTSEGLKKTVGKINKYFAMHFAMTLVDAVQISLLYMLYREYQYDIPMLPVFTLIGVLYEAFVEIRSITEPANIKEKKLQDDFKRLLQSALSEASFRERVISLIEDCNIKDKEV